MERNFYLTHDKGAYIPGCLGTKVLCHETERLDPRKYPTTQKESLQIM